MAFYLRRLGRPAEAVLPVVARAHELAPDAPLYRITLATLLDHVGRRDEAREILRDLDLDDDSCRGCLEADGDDLPRRRGGPSNPAHRPRIQRNSVD